MHPLTGLIKPHRKLLRRIGRCLHICHSLDLALSDFHLFGPLKESLSGIIFENDDAVKQHVLKFLHSTGKDFYAAGFTRLAEH